MALEFLFKSSLLNFQSSNMFTLGSVWWHMNLEPLWAKPDPDSNLSSLLNLPTQSPEEDWSDHMQNHQADSPLYVWPDV